MKTYVIGEFLFGLIRVLRFYPWFKISYLPFLIG